MSLFTKVVAHYRCFILNREFRRIRAAAVDLPQKYHALFCKLTLQELDKAADFEYPYLYATKSDQRYRLWGAGTGIGLGWSRSSNPQLKLRGLALWLAVAYHETNYSPFSKLQKLHKTLLHYTATLKHALPDEQQQQAPHELAA